MCAVDDQVVVLDLKRDRYLSLDTGSSALLRPHVNLLASRQGFLEGDEQSPLGKVLFRLCANGILCAAGTPAAAAEPRCPLICPQSEIAPRAPLGERACSHDLLRYIASVMSAKWALRVYPLHRIVLSERRKKVTQGGACAVFDMARAGRLCGIYSRLRVIATGPTQCLFDALALRLFLSKYELFPDWIFGVRLNPFAAHCWLQHGDTLVNDSLDSVRRFTPIMAV
jgi:hypothetical protein